MLNQEVMEWPAWMRLRSWKSISKTFSIYWNALDLFPCSRWKRYVAWCVTKLVCKWYGYLQLIYFLLMDPITYFEVKICHMLFILYLTLSASTFCCLISPHPWKGRFFCHLYSILYIFWRLIFLKTDLGTWYPRSYSLFSLTDPLAYRKILCLAMLLLLMSVLSSM